MPTDLYRWEEGGGLVHHCPVCKTPLTHEICRSQCLGHHVEWCGRYHTQLFRKDWSSQCAPCKHSEAQHDKRHREIAELLHELKELKQAEKADSRTPAKVVSGQAAATDSPLSKKERKVVKKAAKLASMPKVIMTADIDFVAKVLHPDSHENDEADEERQLLEDPDIKLNLYFHRGTSNTREVRWRHIKHKGNGKGDEDSHIDDEELDGLLAGLKVPQVSKAMTASERRVIEAIRRAVKEDMVNVAKEEAQTNMRKAGFWRWASRKAYNRLVANGRLWDQLEENAETPRRKDSAFSEVADDAPMSPKSTVERKLSGLSISDGASTVAPSTPVSEKRQSGIPYSASNAASAARKGTGSFDDGWTQVGKTVLTPKPKVTLRMSGNGGLAKLQVKPKGMYGAFGRGYGEEGEVEAEE